MEYLGIFITGIVGIISSIVTFFFGRRKYNSEVDNSNIQNMKESLDFYVKLVNDYKQRLTTELESHNKEVAALEQRIATLKEDMRDQELRYDEKFAAQQKEINLMKNQMLSTYKQICLNFSCLERMPSKELNKRTKKVKPTEA